MRFFSSSNSSFSGAESVLRRRYRSDRWRGAWAGVLVLVALSVCSCAVHENGKHSDAMNDGEHVADASVDSTVRADAGTPARTPSHDQAQTGSPSKTTGAGAAGGMSQASNAGPPVTNRDAGSAGGSGGAVDAGAADPMPAATTGSAGGPSAPAAQSGGSAGAPAAASTIDCSRAGLTALVDKYFAALAAHDASQLPLAANVKITADGMAAKLSDGLWASAGALTAHRNVLDTERCGTLTLAVVQNQGKPLVTAVRLQLDAGHITEVEMFTGSANVSQAPSDLDDAMAGDWSQELSPDQRSMRSDLENIANQYFDSYADPAAAPKLASDCVEVSNGVKLTTGCQMLVVPANPLLVMGAPSDRRFPLADLEAGIAVGFGRAIASAPQFHFVMLKVGSGEVRFIHAFWGQPAASWGWN
jgi:hypothetical protein